MRYLYFLASFYLNIHMVLADPVYDSFFENALEDDLETCIDKAVKHKDMIGKGAPKPDAKSFEKWVLLHIMSESHELPSLTTYHRITYWHYRFSEVKSSFDRFWTEIENLYLKILQQDYDTIRKVDGLGLLDILWMYPGTNDDEYSDEELAELGTRFKKTESTSSIASSPTISETESGRSDSETDAMSSNSERSHTADLSSEPPVKTQKVDVPGISEVVR